MERQMDKPMRDLIDIIHFTENVSTKIHGLLDEAEIYMTVKEEFAKSKRYGATIFLLTDDGSKLKVAETATYPGKVKAAEKAAGLRTKEHKFELNKSSILSQVVREEKTIQTNISGLLSEMFPRPLAYIISKILGYEKRPFIATPLKRRGKTMGALAVSSTELAEHFIPSVKNLARHISTALELAAEHTERKRIEEELVHERHLLRVLMDNIPDAIYFKDAASHFMRINRAHAQKMGLNNPKDAVGKSDFDFYAAEFARESYSDEQKIVKTGQPLINKIEKARTTDGRFHWVSASKVPIKDKEGRVTGIVGVSRDITERKKIEERYRDLVEKEKDIIYILDDGGNITFASPAVETILGYRPEEVIGKNFMVLIPKEWQEKTGVDFNNLLKKGEITAETVLLDKKGQLHFVEYSSTVIKEENKVVGTRGIVRDITERKIMEERIAYLASIVDNAKVAIATVDMNGIVTYCNKATEEMLSWASKEVMGKPMARICPNAGKQIEVTMTEGFCLDKELEYVKKDGSSLLCSTSTFLMRDKDGNPIGVGGIAIDTTDRKKAQEMLRESEEKYRVLVESAADAIFTLNEAGDFLSANQEAARAMGKTPEDMISKNMYDLFPKDIADFQMARIKAVFQTGNPILADENVTQTKFGQRWYSTTVIPIRDSNGKIIYVTAIARDITEKKKMEEKLKEYTENLEEIVEERTRKLKEAERLAAIGETAAMVGHDLRNPLQVIINTAYLGEEMVKSMPSPCRELAEKKGAGELFRTVGEQVEYMNKIVSDLQDYARPLKPELVEISLHQLINNTLSTIRVPETVKVSVEIEEDLNFPKLMVDPTMMKRVFINLITNAVQAMPDGGKLTIRAFRTKEAAFVSVQDTGVGISEENLSKLFQPLFTTKPKGTGFGLAVCKRLVEAHDGSITVESKVDKGSIFTVELPLRKEVK